MTNMQDDGKKKNMPTGMNTTTNAEFEHWWKIRLAMWSAIFGIAYPVAGLCLGIWCYCVGARFDFIYGEYFPFTLAYLSFSWFAVIGIPWLLATVKQKRTVRNVREVIGVLALLFTAFGFHCLADLFWGNGMSFNAAAEGFCGRMMVFVILPIGMSLVGPLVWFLDKTYYRSKHVKRGKPLKWSGLARKVEGFLGRHQSPVLSGLKEYCLLCIRYSVWGAVLALLFFEEMIVVYFALRMNGAFACSFDKNFLSDEIRTVALVMPASILPKERFDQGKAALESAGYKVKVMPRLDFGKIAPPEDRVADLEQAWLDPEVDLVLCATGGTGTGELLDKIDWAKLRTRPQRVMGFSNITMLLNAMLKENVGRPYSGPTLSQLMIARQPTFKWLSQVFTDHGDIPDVQLSALRPGACRGLACGGHISCVLSGVKVGHAADTKGRIVFLESVGRTPEQTRDELRQLRSAGYFDDVAGVVFGYIWPCGPNGMCLAKGAFDTALREVDEIKKEFAECVKCPVYHGLAYGHDPVNLVIDFWREKVITEDGVLKANADGKTFRNIE